MTRPADQQRRVAIFVATYRRFNGLRRLLDSLSAQDTCGIELRIVIVDNDPAGSALDVVQPYLQSAVNISYVVEPDPGIPAARNRSIALARELEAEFAAFIDDDEVASPHWIASLLAAIEETSAAASTGPVFPIFPERAPQWAQISTFFTRPVFDNGAEVDYASTANSMIRLRALEGIDRPFPDSFRYSGGSDTYVYQSLRKRRERIVWTNHAVVYEYVPRDRIRTSWLIARHYRQGITLARCDRLILGRRAAVKRGARGTGLIVAGAIETVLGAFFRARDWRRGLTRIGRGSGSIVGLIGITYEEYRRTGG